MTRPLRQQLLTTANLRSKIIKIMREKVVSPTAFQRPRNGVHIRIAAVWALSRVIMTQSQARVIVTQIQTRITVTRVQTRLMLVLMIKMRLVGKCKILKRESPRMRRTKMRPKTTRTETLGARVIRITTVPKMIRAVGIRLLC